MNMGILHFEKTIQGEVAETLGFLNHRFSHKIDIEESYSEDQSDKLSTQVLPIRKIT